MSKPANNILFASIDSIPLLDKAQAAKELLALDESMSFWDDYRSIRMISLMSKNGGTTLNNITNSQEGEFVWTEFTPQIIIDWFENHVFPWLGKNARVMALLTMPGASNSEHIDWSSHELNTQQHKFRVVLQGRTDTLYWLTDKGKVFAPNIDKAFVMDGGWPHGMTNSTNEIKVTLALGAPWNGKDSYDDITILQDRNDFVMPEDINHLWNS
jgi:hypothetical protein